MVVQSCYQRALIVDQPGTKIDSHDDNRDDYSSIKVEARGQRHWLQGDVDDFGWNPR